MAALIPKEFIQECIERTDLVALIEAYVPLKKKGNTYKACCPFHKENTPSFNVHPHKQFYHCFGCGANGNAISFLMDHDHQTFVEAVKTLAANASLPLPKLVERKAVQYNRPDPKPNQIELLDNVSRFFQQQLREHPGAKAAIAYLKERGITGSVAKTFEIGYAPEGWDTVKKRFSNSTADLLETGLLIKNENGRVYDRFRDRIIFPIRNRRGNVIGFGGRALGEALPKYLNSPETSLFHKGRELYHFHRALDQTPLEESVIVVEGYMDVIALAQFDCKQVVATLGTAVTSAHVEQLFRYFQTLVFCFDGDEAGEKAAWRALETSLPLLTKERQVRFMMLPKGEDPDTLVRQLGKDGFKKRVHAAESLNTFLFDRSSQTCDLTTLDGKARFIHRVGNIMSQMKDPTRHVLLCQELSRWTNLSVEQVQKMLKTPTRSTASVIYSQHRLKPTQLALALLLQQPELARSVSAEHRFEETSHSARYLNELLALCHAHPTWSTGQMLEHFRGTENFDRLSQLATIVHHVPEEGIEAEFKATFEKELAKNTERSIQALLQKAKREALSDVERTLLQDLIVARKRAT